MQVPVGFFSIHGLSYTCMLLEAVRHFRSVVIDAGSRVTTAHAHQCCIFQSYAKTVPSRMKLTMKLNMREPASMTTDTWSRRVAFYSNSVLHTNTMLAPFWFSTEHCWMVFWLSTQVHVVVHVYWNQTTNQWSINMKNKFIHVIYMFDDLHYN